MKISTALMKRTLYGMMALAVLFAALGGVNLKKVYAQNDSPVSISISADKNSFGSDEDVVLHVTLSNSSSNDIRVLNWFTPFGVFTDPLFNVSVDGQPVPFTGAIYKRTAPTQQDYILLAAGESRSADINLGSYYNLSATGNYSVEYSVASESLYLDENGAMLSGGFSSDALSLFVEGHFVPAPASEDELFAAASNSFVSCSAARQSSLALARTAADVYAANDVAYFSSAKNGARYTTWFGVYDAARYNSVKSHFTKVKNVTGSAAITFNCSCTDSGVYAYVYPDDPYKIYLCGAFWPSPTSGTDSQAGTLIHEISHFTAVAGTDDFVYGQTGAKNLAKTNPAKAIMNADNHEYFSENNPPLETGSTTTNAIKDPGFEKYTTSSPWTQSSTNYGTPLCTVADCGTDGGIAGPHKGSVWAWFGGTSKTEKGSISQKVTFPKGTAKLKFYLWIGAAPAGSSSADVLNVTIDGVKVFSTNATKASLYPTYKLVTVNANAFANGAVHTIKFASATAGQAVTFNVDDLSLTK